MDLTEFHEKNWQRMHEAFAPAHSANALLVCIAEELGELSGALLGVTGEKKRKANKTIADVLDAVADALTYASLLARSIEQTESAFRLYSSHKADFPLREASAAVEHLGGVAFFLRVEDRAAAAIKISCLVEALVSIAGYYGCIDWQYLLFSTFNMVSDRAGSSIKIDLETR